MTIGFTVNQYILPFNTFIIILISYHIMILPTHSVDTVNIDLQSKFGLDTLHRAVSLRNADLVELLLSEDSHSSTNQSFSVDNRKHDFSLNAKNSDGHNALHLALLHGSSDILRILLRHGADTSVVTNRGVTALHMAVSSTNIDIVLLILDRIITDNDAKQILHQYIDIQDNEGYTALHRAAIRGSRDIVSLLLKNGADRSVRTFTGQTVLHSAVIGNNSDCVQLLMNYGLKMYEYISTLSDVENIVDVNVQDNRGNTALHFAVILRKNDMIRTMLGLNADLSVRNHEGRTPLHIATSEKGFAEVSSLLHTLSGFDLNKRDTNHMSKTIVHHTTGNGEKNIVRHFLKYRAYSKLHCKQEQTPLHAAGLPNTQRGNVEIEEIEVEAPDINEQNLGDERSFVNIQDGDGATALHRVVDRFDVDNDIVKLLLYHGADFLNLKNKNGETVLQLALQKADLSTVKLLMNKGVDVAVVDKEGWTLLMFAAKGGHRGVVKEILDAGADLSRRDEQGLTALHHAGSGYVVNILLNYGADIGAQSKDGSTPLHYAIRTKHIHDVVESLFLACYQFDKKDIMGKTAMDYFYENMKSSPQSILMIEGGSMNKNEYSVQFIFGLFKAAGIMEHVTKDMSTKFTPCLDRICDELSKEVDEIKSTFIDNVSLYTVLNYQLTDLRFLTKPEMKIMLEEESLYDKFKYYHHLIQIRFDQAQELLTLLDELSVIFSCFLLKTLKLNIPSEVCRMILVRTSHMEIRKIRAIFKS